MVSGEAARQPVPSTNMVPSEVGLLHSACASGFGEEWALSPAPWTSPHCPGLMDTSSPSCILGIGTERCLPVSPKTAFVSRCVTEERGLETSFEVRAVFGLRKSRGGLDSWKNTGFEVRHSQVWIQPWSYRCVTLSKFMNISRPQRVPI